MNEKCEACSAREQEHGYGVVCEHNTPQEKEPWEVQLRELWLHIGDYEELLNFVKSLLDAERAELVKEVIEIVGFVDEDFLTTPDCEEYPAEWAINKDRQRIIKALDTVIEKIKNK